MDHLLEDLARYIELAGAGLLLIGLVVSSGRYVYSVVVGEARQGFAAYRRDIARTLLLTLEFLIAADILQTMAVETTLSGLASLGFLIVIRTFLSFSLELELNGRWPWQSRRDTADPD